MCSLKFVKQESGIKIIIQFRLGMYLIHRIAKLCYHFDMIRGILLVSLSRVFSSSLPETRKCQVGDIVKVVIQTKFKVYYNIN